MGKKNIYTPNLIKVKSKQALGIKGGYMVCQKEFITDFTLSAKAKELFLVLWSAPQDFRVSTKGIMGLYASYGSHIAKNTIRAYFDELEQRGYLSKELQGYARQGSKTVPCYVYTLYEISRLTEQVYVDDLSEARAETEAPDINF